MEVVLADWVFGYGSLIWNPEIDYEHSELARLHGYHRAFCIRSTRYRGTPERPGVVLGLDYGGSCIGMAFRLRPERRREAIDRLYEREMTQRVYVPQLANVTLRCGQRIRALTFVANRRSDAYQRLPDQEVVRRMTDCCGQRGRNVDYLINTWHALREHGVHDAMLNRLAGHFGGHRPLAAVAAAVRAAEAEAAGTSRMPGERRESDAHPSAPAPSLAA